MFFNKSTWNERKKCPMSKRIRQRVLWVPQTRHVTEWSCWNLPTSNHKYPESNVLYWITSSFLVEILFIIVRVLVVTKDNPEGIFLFEFSLTRIEIIRRISLSISRAVAQTWWHIITIILEGNPRCSHKIGLMSKQRVLSVINSFKCSRETDSLNSAFLWK